MVGRGPGAIYPRARGRWTYDSLRRPRPWPWPADPSQAETPIASPAPRAPVASQSCC